MAISYIDDHRAPCIGDGERLPADHPDAPRLRAAGDRAARALIGALDGLDGLADVGDGMIALRRGDSVWLARRDRHANQVCRGRAVCGPAWSARAVQSVAPRQSILEAIRDRRASAEARAWQEIVAGLCR